MYLGSTSAIQQINQNTRCLRNVKEHLQISKCCSVTNSKKLKSHRHAHIHIHSYTHTSLTQLVLVTSTNSLFCEVGSPIHTSPNGHVGALAFACSCGAPFGLLTHALVSKHPMSSHRHP